MQKQHLYPPLSPEGCQLPGRQCTAANGIRRLLVEPLLMEWQDIPDGVALIHFFLNHHVDARYASFWLHLWALGPAAATTTLQRHCERLQRLRQHADGAKIW